ncbi:MAG: acylphosphatase [Spirochaetaceae bacterium]|jgi:acylphosphatase|nr:acylphosphatase [Spirochaetaceae bacterium]
MSNFVCKEKTIARAAFDAIVHGHVQHVGFRYYACAEAESLGISGWIRNNPGGEVEIRAEGETGKLKKFLLWLNKGPPHGRVDSVNVHWREAQGTYKGFVVDYDL